MRAPALYLLPLACTLALAACGSKDTPAASSDDVAAQAAAASADNTATAAQPSLPQPDLRKPLAEYRQLDSGQQVMLLYVAASKLPPDFEKLAQSYSHDYRTTSDTFRRRDLMVALKPQLEQGIAEAAAAPYVWMDIDDAELQPYDFDRKGFTVGEFDANRRRWFNDGSDYKFTWNNPAQVQFAPVADEAVARELEAMRGKWDNKPQLRVYFFAQSADLNAPLLKTAVTHVQLRDRSGRVLASYSADQSQPGQPAAAEPCGTAEDCARRDAGG